MRTITVAATQTACSGDHASNLDQAETLVREAAYCSEEAPGFGGCRRGLVYHLCRIHFGETTNALFEPAIQSNRRNCWVF